MAMNPMQRKANNYLLIGIFSTLVVTGAIIAFLFMQLRNLRAAEQKREGAMKTVQVASEDIKSGGQILEKITTKKVDGQFAPANSLTKEITEKTIAKINLNKGTIITDDMVQESEEETTNDLRKQEYNMIIMPSQISNGDYVDIRLMLSSGVDFIVASKKQVTIPEIDGVPSANTMIVNMDETEILVMSNAIVEAYIDQGSILYATTYVEPGMQTSVTPTYVPSGTVQNAINANPNITQEAKNTLFARYNQNAGMRTNVVDQTLAQYNQDRVDNIEAGIQEQITKARQERERYLETLGGY